MKQFLAKLPKPEILMIFGVLVVIGIIRLIYELCLLTKRKQFAEEYFSKYRHLMGSDIFDEGCYQWLVYNVERMQKEMGEYGSASSYRPPFANYMIRNYSIVLNTILNMKDDTVSPSDLTTVENYLVRYIGVLNHAIAEKWKGIFNPFVWLTRGVRCILFYGPIWIFRSVGLIRYTSPNTMGDHLLVRLISGLISLFFFIAALASLLSGWDALVRFLERILGSIDSIEIN